MQGVFPLTGKVQHYSWGGSRFIPQLLRIDNAAGLPYAEYWLGAHPNFPSTIERNGQQESLAAFLDHEGKDALGAEVAAAFKSLPYLFKILDVEQMLSIQVHPSLAEARKGYEAENKAGVPITAPHRNYKDANHKPEQMVALGDFYLLHGFKPVARLTTLLSTIPELAFLTPILLQEGYRGLYAHVMTMDQEAVNALWQPLAARLLAPYEAGALVKADENFWVARALTTFCKDGTYDRGLFSIYFLNLVMLRRGESVFQPAGMPHAYLEGQNIEVMANSDNVLRGGLTNKHIDIDELMRHTEFIPTEPQVLKPDESGVYLSGAEEFVLYAGGAGMEAVPYMTSSAEIIFVLSGALSIGGSTSLQLDPGSAAFVSSGTEIRIQANGHTEFYRVSVPGA